MDPIARSDRTLEANGRNSRKPDITKNIGTLRSVRATMGASQASTVLPSPLMPRWMKPVAKAAWLSSTMVMPMPR